jgi:putative transposase
MAEKHYKPEEIVAKLRQVDVLISQGQNIADAIRQIGVSEVTYYRWRRDFGGLKTEQVKRLQNLERENIRLRKAVSELMLDKLILQEVRAQLMSAHVAEHRTKPTLKRRSLYSTLLPSALSSL